MTTIAAILTAVVSVLVLAIATFVAANWESDRPLAELEARWAPTPSTFLDVQGMSAYLRGVGPRADTVPIVLLHGTSSGSVAKFMLKRKEGALVCTDTRVI